MANYNGKSIPTDGSKDIITWSEEQKTAIQNVINAVANEPKDFITKLATYGGDIQTSPVNFNVLHASSTVNGTMEATSKGIKILKTGYYELSYSIWTTADAGSEGKRLWLRPNWGSNVGSFLREFPSGAREDYAIGGVGGVIRHISAGTTLEIESQSTIVGGVDIGGSSSSFFTVKQV